MDRTLMAVRLCAAGAALLIVAAAGSAPAAVTMQLTSATVNNPGEAGRMCVMLSTGGAQVAGTQNDLIWDGNCASLPDEKSCFVAGAHGKELSAATKCGDFCLRAIILSLSDVNPIPDGPLYCCNFQSESDAGGCCGINMTNAAASDPEGKAISASGSGGRICTSGSSNNQGRAVGSINQPLSGSNMPPGDMGGAPVAPAAPAAPAPRAPASQVLQGGGARVGGTPEAVAQAQPTLPAQLATLPAAIAPTARAANAAPQAPAPPAAQAPLAPALTPPTVAATHAAPTAAAAVGTPTHRAAAAPTKAATKPAVPTAKQVQAPAQAEERGWFGCQIGTAASAAPVIDLGLLMLVGALIRRRAGSHTLRSRGAHGDNE
jgi:hypothetical protein